MFFKYILIAIIFSIFGFSPILADEPRIVYWPNGVKKAETKIVKGKRNGLSTEFHQGGNKSREVEFKDDKENGKEMRWSERGTKIFEVAYKLGKKNGKEISWHENGSKSSEKEYKDGIEFGLSTSWYPTGAKSSEADFRNGKKTGKATKWFENGSIDIQCDYIDDIRNGKEIKYDEKGNLVYETEYKDGLKNGKAIEVIFRENNQTENPGGQVKYKEDPRIYRPTGMPVAEKKEMVPLEKREMVYKNGDLNGLFTVWYLSGAKKSECFYANGKKSGKHTEWFENGTKQLELEYLNNTRNGIESKWNSNGVKLSEIEYKDGLKNGMTTIWDADGNKTTEQEYKNGEVIKNYLAPMLAREPKNENPTETPPKAHVVPTEESKQVNLVEKEVVQEKNQPKVAVEEIKITLTPQEIELLENSNLGKILRKTSLLKGNFIFTDPKESYIIFHGKDKKLGFVLNEAQSSVLKSSFIKYQDSLINAPENKEIANNTINSIGNIKIKKVLILNNDQLNELEIKDATIFFQTTAQGESLDKSTYIIVIPKLKSLKEQIVTESTQRLEFLAKDIEKINKAIETKLSLEKQLQIEVK